MTAEEQELADDQARALIAKLNAETQNLSALTSKAMIEAEKIRTENRWYPAIAGAGFMAGAVALAKLFLT